MGVGLDRSVKSVWFDDRSGQMCLGVELGDGNDRREIPTGWSDAGMVDVVASWLGNWGMGLDAVATAMARTYPQLSAEQVGQACQHLFAELAKRQALIWWFAEDGAASDETSDQTGLRHDAPLCHVQSQSRLFHAAYSAGPVPEDAELSRFTFVRRDQGKTILENAETFAKLLVGSDAGAVLARVYSETQNGSDPLWHFLWRCGFLEVPVQETDARKGWAFHDRVFHASSRKYLNEAAIGATYHLRDKLAAPPAEKPPMSDKPIALARPAGTRLPSGQGLYDVMGARHSVRTPGCNPLSLTELGDLLWRTVSTRGRQSWGGQNVITRPIPAGGSVHDLEIYVLVHRCDGLAPGFYHYHGGEHALYALQTPETICKAMLSKASQAMGETDDFPDSVIVMASRLLRLSWKYQNMAYRLSLLHAGVAMEALYLVATEMGLGPCANGTGDTALFALATGIPVDEETSVAEFALNGRVATSDKA